MSWGGNSSSLLLRLSRTFSCTPTAHISFPGRGAIKVPPAVVCNMDYSRFEHMDPVDTPLVFEGPYGVQSLPIPPFVKLRIIEQRTHTRNMYSTILNREDQKQVESWRTISRDIRKCVKEVWKGHWARLHAVGDCNFTVIANDAGVLKPGGFRKKNWRVRVASEGDQKQVDIIMPSFVKPSISARNKLLIRAPSKDIALCVVEDIINRSQLGDSSMDSFIDLEKVK